MIVRPSVDLPHPDSPTSPSVSPFLTSRSTPSTAWTCATVRRTMFDATGNHFFSERTETSGSEGVHARASSRCFVSTILQLTAALGDPAGRQLRIADPRQERHVAGTALDLERAPGMKRAAGRKVDQVRRRSADRAQRLVSLRVEAGDRAQKRPRVWMLGMREDVGGRPGLDDLSRVHD